MPHYTTWIVSLSDHNRVNEIQKEIDKIDQNVGRSTIRRMMNQDNIDYLL